MYEFVPHAIGAEVPAAFTAPSQAPPIEPGLDHPAPATGAAATPDSASSSASTPPPAAPSSSLSTVETPQEAPPLKADLTQTTAAGEAANESEMGVKADEPPDATTKEADGEDSATKPVVDRTRVLRLSDALAYASGHAWDVQTAKEDLYLAGLDLSLERHLWTPQFVANVQAQFADYGQIRDFDRATTLVGEVAVSQKLPFGGDVTARVINTLMRDLGRHITSGETGQVILSANIPLFRGAGRVAYESRYITERQLIYAVRTYERFRRTFLVSIAGDYFDLQQAKAAVINAEISRKSLAQSTARAEMFFDLNQSDVFEVGRVRSSLRGAEFAVQNAIERFESALDQFKIRIGMPVTESIDVVSLEEDAESRAIELLLPDVAEAPAVEVAIAHRLDLLNVLDRIDDARRGVVIARNALLPSLDLSGSVAMGTDPEQLSVAAYDVERTTWRGQLNFSMTDRMAERNQFRESLIGLRRGERDYDEAADQVRADVRRALRQLEQTRRNLQIQAANVKENEIRRAGAEAVFNEGRGTNQDLVDAENDLLNARNALAAARAGYRTAILEFRLSTDTLPIDDEGQFETGSTPGG